MSNNLIGRVAEASILRELRSRPTAQFLAVYGRRRVGKTYLIRNSYKESIVFESTAMHEATKPEQIENFWLDLIKRSNPSTLVPTSWRIVFSHLENYLEATKTPKSGKKVIFLDELPWYDTPMHIITL